MSPQVRDAIESAREPRVNASYAPNPRRYSFEHVWFTVLAVLRDIPEGMTVADLREELELANNQGDES